MRIEREILQIVKKKQTSIELHTRGVFFANKYPGDLKR
jgi:hypothetical protein